jgi:glycerophosphoryl diester phosphodiesterase
MIVAITILLVLSFSALAKKVVIAHRGAPGYLPEHTLEGVAMAHSWGVDYIEPDIVLTKDNKAVVLHDIHIDTTTNVAEIFKSKKRADGRYYAIDFTLAQLKQLKVTERFDYKTGKRIFSKRFPKSRINFKIPTFVEFIELVQGLNTTKKVDIGIYPEIKSPEFHKSEGKDITKVVFNLMSKYGYNKKSSNSFIQCFYPPTLKRLKGEFKAKMPLVFLIAENSWKESSIDYDYFRTEKGLKEVAKYVDGIGPYLKHLIIKSNGVYSKSNLVSLAHKHNLKVHPYTHRVDSLPLQFNTNKKLFKFLYEEVGVDGIFSDFGDIALTYSNID